MAFKYNPGFLSDQDSILNFVVRHKDLRIITDLMFENIDAPSNRHLLIIGPRGSGKTTLARRIVAEIRTNTELSKQWLPVVLGEESYTVSNAGEFWLECLFHLAEQMQDRPEITERYRAIQREEDDIKVRELALGALVSFAKTQSVRLLIVAENLNMILEDQMNTHEAWTLRHSLQNVPEIMLFATATKKFEDIQSIDKAMFEQFKIHELRPLTVNEIATLWNAFTNERLGIRRARPIQILTGGSPRLITILAEFAIDHSLLNLMGKLSALIDQYTDYFKSQLDALAPAERKVFVAVLEKWDPATSREVASEARVTVKTASALLDRLRKRGSVQRRTSGSLQYWEASERLFNLYYLMRRRGGASSRVFALVRFMTVFYEKDQLFDRAKDLVAECGKLEPQFREDHYSVLNQIINRFDISTRQQFLQLTPPDVAKQLSSSTFGENRYSTSKNVERQILELVYKQEYDQAVAALDEARDTKEFASLWALVGVAISMTSPDDPRPAELFGVAESLDPNDSDVHYYRSLVFEQKRDLPEALLQIERAVQLDADEAHYWIQLGDVQGQLGNSREAERAYRRAIQADRNSGAAWFSLGRFLASESMQPLGAEEALRKALSLEPNNNGYAIELAEFLTDSKRDYAGASQLYREVLKKDTASGQAWDGLLSALNRLGASVTDIETEYKEAFSNPALMDGWRVDFAFSKALHSHHEHKRADEILRSAVSRHPDNTDAWFNLARTLTDSTPNRDEKVAAYEKALTLDPTDSRIWSSFGDYLSEAGLRVRDAEVALRKSVELSPSICGPWQSLAEHLERTGQRDEARTCFEKALKINPNCACSIPGYSRILADDQGFDGVESFLSGFIERMPNNPAPHIALSSYLSSLKHEHRAAVEQAFLALNKGASPFRLISPLLSAVNFDEPKQTITDLKKFLRATRKGPELSNVLAWRIWRRHPSPELIKFALDISERAVEEKKEIWDFRETLATLYLADHQIDQAIEQVKWLADQVKSDDLDSFVDLCIRFARTGNSKDLLDVLVKSSSRGTFEPVIAALRIVLGEDPPVAKEILEVAKDIQKQIVEPEDVQT